MVGKAVRRKYGKAALTHVTSQEASSSHSLGIKHDQSPPPVNLSILIPTSLYVSLLINDIQSFT